MWLQGLFLTCVLPLSLQAETKTTTETDDEIISEETMGQLLTCGFVTVATGGLIKYGPKLIGLEKIGIRKGSTMAKIQSKYGNVPKGSIFSKAQSWASKGKGFANPDLDHVSVGGAAASGGACLAVFQKLWGQVPQEYQDRLEEYVDEVAEFVLFTDKNGRDFTVGHGAKAVRKFSDEALEKIGGVVDEADEFLKTKGIDVGSGLDKVNDVIDEIKESEPYQKVEGVANKAVKETTNVVNSAPQFFSHAKKKVVDSSLATGGKIKNFTKDSAEKAGELIDETLESETFQKVERVGQNVAEKTVTFVDQVGGFFRGMFGSSSSASDGSFSLGLLSFTILMRLLAW